MNESALQNYEELCRLCASYDAIKIPIFSEQGKERSLRDKITTCLPFEVSEDDLYPKSLCYRCIYNLENFYDFRRGCIDARARLERVIKQFLKQESEETSSGKINQAEKEEEFPHRLEDDIVESDNEEDVPNPADFLEACLGESPQGNNDDEGPLSCKVCGRLFNSKSSLTIHAKFHQDCGGGGPESERDFACYVCDKVFSSKGHLALHSKVHIGETATSSSSTLPLYTKSSAPSQPRLYQCDLCHKSYSMAKHLWGHVSTAHKGHPLVTCCLCQRTFSSVANLEDHKRVKHKGEVTTNGELGGNLDGSASDKKFSLDEVPSNKRKSSKPRKIERDMAQQGPYGMEEGRSPQNLGQEGSTVGVQSCFLCGEKFSDASLFGKHLLEVHNYEGPVNNLHNEYVEGELMESMMEAETVFCCEICIREFNDRASLWLHMLYSHKDAASKACGICLKICTDNESLIQHVDACHPRSKTEQRRYSCQVCARQHDSRKKLVSHAKIHKLTDGEGRLVDPETVVVQNSEYYGGELTTSAAALQPSTQPSLQPFMPSCDVCFKIFETDAKLAKHRRGAHRDSLGLNGSGSNHFYFACEICGLSHLNRTERWKHMASTHAGDPSVTCDVAECGKVFATSAVKNEHTSTHHAAQGQYPNTCEICGKIWKTRVEYWKHMMGVHPDCLPFVCGVCLKVFSNLSNLVDHVRGTHWPLVGGDFCCDICGRPYSKVSKMTRHRKVHYVANTSPELQALLENPKIDSEVHFLQQPSTLVCDLCEGSTHEYENVEELGKHRLETHKVMPCDLCTKYYGRTSHLWKHVNKIHKGHPDVTCPICQRTSASKSHLAAHMGKHHRNEEKKSDPDSSTPTGSKIVNGLHTCEKCEKIFRKETLVKKHIKHCRGPRPPPMPLPPPVNGIYTCERCPKSFSQPNLLYKHMKGSHVTYKCEICSVKINTKTELYQHVSQEHGDHPDVRCNYQGCNIILRCKADLERHQKGHRTLSVQLHYCIFCAELITSKFKMRRHLKAMHGKETKCLCSLCLKAFPDFEELREHVESQHGAALERGFTCQICAKPCSNKSKLMEHIKYHGTHFMPCKICLKIFSSKEELDNHINNHPDSGDEEDQIEDVDMDPSSILDIIGASTSDVNIKLDDKNVEKRKIRSDDSTASQIKKVKAEVECEICSDKFKSNAELRRHTRNVHKKKNSSLNSSNLTEKMGDEDSWELSMERDPDMTFMHQLGLMPDNEKAAKLRNARKVYKNDYTPSECELCGKIWPAKRHLWQHLVRFHREEAGTTCGVCVKLCPDYACLSAHLALEHPANFEGDGSGLSCKVCGKYHNAKSKLQNHAAVHPGHEARALHTHHLCLLCPQTFEEFGKFSHHIRNEHKIEVVPTKPNSITSKSVEAPATPARQETKLPFHSCDICSLVFASEIGLTNHRRIHENSDNFKCGQCGEFFPSAETLCTHKLQKHKGTEFVCADCKSNFSTYNQLTEHNKECKMKMRNMAEANSDIDDEDMLLDDDIEELENSYEANDTNDLSSVSDGDEERIEDNVTEATASGEGEDVDDEEEEEEGSRWGEEEEGSVVQWSHEEPRAVEVFLCDSTVEVVQVDLSDDGSNSKVN